MVNLTIRLNSKGGSTSAAGTPRASGGTPGITAGAAPHSSTPRLVCGPHLTMSDLPLASGVGLVPSVHSESTAISGLGVKVRRQPGNKVHFCVRCNFPIAIYGRLDPCEHVFCLVCSKKDINCYLCEEGILRIQKIELLEGIFVCGAAGCLRSFLSKPEFEWHVKDAHLDLLPSREAAAPSTKPIDGLDQQQSLGGPREPSSSPSQQSQPASPPPYNNNTWRQENAARPSSPGPEKQGKPPHLLGPSRDHSEPQSTRRRADQQPSAAAREKDKERDSQQQGQRDREHAQPDRDQSMREREPSQRERDRDRDRIRDRERDSDRDRERDFSTQSHRDRDRELWEQQQQHAQQQYPQQQQGNAHYPLPPPPPLPPLPFQSNAPGPPNQPGGTPGPYPPQQPFPPFHPQQQDSRNAARFESSRHAPFIDPRMGVPPDFQENNLRGRHPQQDGERARNMPPHPQQDGYGLVMERQGLMLPHFHGEFGAPPMGMMMGHQAMQGMNRFQDGGHGGSHLPPPHKRGNFGPGGEPGMGHPQHMFGWGGPANFGGGPGHPQFMNWQPPQ